MKIYDCFTFYNELDLLELRLQELYDHVDHFVIVEGNITFTNIEKPFYFKENQERFSQYLDKIIYVQVNDMPKNTDAWANETFQRNAIARGIVDADDNDIIVISDLDEIVRPSTLDQMRDDTENQIWGLRMPLFNFKFNYMLTSADRYNVWAMASRKGLLVPANDLRNQRFELMSFPYEYNQNGIRLMEHAGWQFTYLGDTEFARNKIKSFSHTQTNTPEIIEQLDIERSIQNGDGIYHHPDYKFTAVKVDAYFPLTIQQNQERYASLLINQADSSALDFLPAT